MKTNLTDLQKKWIEENKESIKECGIRPMEKHEEYGEVLNVFNIKICSEVFPLEYKIMREITTSIFSKFYEYIVETDKIEIEKVVKSVDINENGDNIRNVDGVKIGFENVEKKYFNSIEKKVEEIVVPSDFETFLRYLNEYKPRAIFNSEYSEKKPLWIITEYPSRGIEYTKEHVIYFYAESWANKSPHCATISQFYEYLNREGLEYSYFWLM